MGSNKKRANAIRALSMDAVQRANSGHPGMPMGMADIAEVLWHRFLKHNPKNPRWMNRDRFVLSNGHGSMLLYALLHLTGYELSLDELKNFRQLGSTTAGHPENFLIKGVETTTGPLGQGLANAVGMALAEKLLAQEFNRPGHTIIDHHTYCFIGDGCLMEGVSHEVSSLAGTWGLNKLIVLWDDNSISIDGDLAPWFTTDIPKQFEAYGWHVIKNIDGHKPELIEEAILTAKTFTDKPTLICCKTTIGFGSPNFAGSEKCHGSPLGDKEIALAREALAWPYAPFEIPADLYEDWSAVAAGASCEAAWQETFAAYKTEYPALAEEFERRMQGALPANWPTFRATLLNDVAKLTKAVATRKASLNCIEALAPQLPELIGGSADLSGSNCTKWSASHSLGIDPNHPNYIHYGVREFGMSAIMNGVTLHGGYKIFGGTFLVFSDYARNAVRMSALMNLPVTYIYSHDSIGLGEDGPTHQPIEHAASLRLIPNLQVWRPCDQFETLVAWLSALETPDQPHALLLSRQDLPAQVRTEAVVQNVARGGYILKEPTTEPEFIIIATGSELQLAVAAADALKDRAIRVVSMPCVEVFLQQDAAYRATVLPAKITKRLAIEAGVSAGWYQFVGSEGLVLGLDHFGESAPAEKLFEKFGFTVDNVVQKLRFLEEKK